MEGVRYLSCLVVGVLIVVLLGLMLTVFGRGGRWGAVGFWLLMAIMWTCGSLMMASWLIGMIN